LIYSHSPSALGVIERALVVKPVVAEFISRPNLKRVKKSKKKILIDRDFHADFSLPFLLFPKLVFTCAVNY
jgi:hypothetical protein